LEAGRTDEARHYASGSARSGAESRRSGRVEWMMIVDGLTTNGDAGSDRPLKEPISPELVLVDPSLRDLILRSEPESTSDQPASPVPEPIIRPGAADGLVALRAELAAPDPPAPRRRWAALAVAAVCGSAATFAAGLALAGFRLNTTHSATPATDSAARTSDVTPITRARTLPAVASHPVVNTDHGELPARRAVTTARHQTKIAGAQKSPTAATPHRFAWPPAPGATSYQVAVYKNDVPVFRARTARTSIVIPERSSQSPSARLLAPGTYRWYVWPIHNGRTDSVALVRSTFVVRGR
jgi:hypothetical protein